MRFRRLARVSNFCSGVAMAVSAYRFAHAGYERLHAWSLQTQGPITPGGSRKRRHLPHCKMAIAEKQNIVSDRAGQRGQITEAGDLRKSETGDFRGAPDFTGVRFLTR